MAALTGSRNTPEWDGVGRKHYGLIPVEASTTIYVGGIVGLNAAGNAIVPTNAATTKVILGICEYVYAGGIVPPGLNAANQTGNGAFFPGATATLGTAGAISVGVVNSVFGVDHDGSVTAAIVGQLVYIIDDHTVTTSTNSNAAACAGTLMALDGGLAFVDFTRQSAIAA